MRDAANTETSTANEQLVAPQSVEPAQSPVPTVMAHVVIVGAGFDGLNAARALRDAPVQVTVIDRNNHHLLYQVATAAISPAEISAPIRNVLRKQQTVVQICTGASTMMIVLDVRK